VLLHVADDGAAVVPLASAGIVHPLEAVAAGMARRISRDGRPLIVVDSEERRSGRRWRHAACPLAHGEGGTYVLALCDTTLPRREAQAIATWAAPRDPGAMRVYGGRSTHLAHSLARRLDVDVVAFGIFAASGMHLRLHTRSGALLQIARVPNETVWGEAARHGAAFTLGDLPVHDGAAALAALGMSTAALVGLDNGGGVPLGALGVASSGRIAPDMAHELLGIGPGVGPEIMRALATTEVPVPDADGTINLDVLAARVGCERFAMYDFSGGEVRFVAAHARDGSLQRVAPDERERALVRQAVEHGIGAFGPQAAAVLVGGHTVLYAHDPGKRVLECLRRALDDIRRNPFGGGLEEQDRAA
jgi:hypothetical protein